MSSTYQSAFRHYSAFCQRMDVPVFPITNALFALWMFNKCSTGDGHFRTYKAGLSYAVELSSSDWKGQPVYEELSRFDPDGTALDEFMEERRLTYKVKRRPSTRRRLHQAVQVDADMREHSDRRERETAEQGRDEARLLVSLGHGHRRDYFA